MERKLSESLVSICMAILGVCLIAWADNVTNLISMLLGIVVIVYGVTKIINYLHDKDNITDLILGIIILVVGGVLVFRASFLKELVSFIVGIYILISSASTFVYVMKNNKENKNSIILSVTGIVLGLLCIVGKFLIPDIILQLIGVLMVIYGVMNIVNVFLIDNKKI
jgi:uncharacterized membrane protein HdeD (DUF308 family)